MPGGPINTVAEALNDPQIVHRGLLVEPGGVPGLRTPISFSRNTLETDRAAPALGSGSWSFSKLEKTG
ncbi:MAG: CoA transferase [Parvibaculum sp.]